jgi:hypothetical protein
MNEIFINVAILNHLFSPQKLDNCFEFSLENKKTDSIRKFRQIVITCEIHFRFSYNLFLF